jgi:putative PIN family toxin of toxin-antitoxin system
MVRVVLDTNIYISAILVGGKPEQIIDLAREGEIEVYISKPILTEIERILKEKIGHTDKQTQIELLDIKSIAKFTSVKIRKIKAIKDEPDNRILECAVQEKTDYLISGDTKHLQPLKEYRGIKIVSPAEFLNEVIEEQ